MDVRAQVSMVFHLDKCIGCHTCSVSCKNVWTDRKGAEYMWWNNVETKPGTGYPTLWEDQEKYRGGFVRRGDDLRLRIGGRGATLARLFHNPRLPTLDDYYEPWSYRYGDLFDAPEGDDQPTARPISAVTGKEIAIEAGPNWDDDLGGSPVYAAADPFVRALSPDERRQLFALDRLFFFHIPRICNHCLNPGCLAACPAGAVYKRGEDGIVLVSQEKCRAWRICVSGCPYKKTYYNWDSGKAEKCILCYPRVETGQAPACFHSCVGRIRYLGVLLYDASRIFAAAKVPDTDLVAAHREIVLDPADDAVVREGRANGISDGILAAARRSPVYRFVKEFGLALPLRAEFRTVPMLFYVPPLLPVAARLEGGTHRIADDSFSSLESSRVPIRYMADLFAAGNETVVADALRKQAAVRIYRKAKETGDVSGDAVRRALAAGKTTPEEAEAIFRITAIASIRERYVFPPLAREAAVETRDDPHTARGATGTGLRRPPERRW